jgi:hypothetical protein
MNEIKVIILEIQSLVCNLATKYPTPNRNQFPDFSSLVAFLHLHECMIIIKAHKYTQITK